MPFVPQPGRAGWTVRKSILGKRPVGIGLSDSAAVDKARGQGWDGGRCLGHREPLWSRVTGLSETVTGRCQRWGSRAQERSAPSQPHPQARAGPGPLVGFHPRLRPLSSELQAWAPTLSRAASGVSLTRRSLPGDHVPPELWSHPQVGEGTESPGQALRSDPQAARSPGRPGPACARTWAHPLPERGLASSEEPPGATCTCGLSPQRALFPASHSGSLQRALLSPHLGPGLCVVTQRTCAACPPAPGTGAIEMVPQDNKERALAPASHTATSACARCPAGAVGLLQAPRAGAGPGCQALPSLCRWIPLIRVRPAGTCRTSGGAKTPLSISRSLPR